jgi:hypothetical protein
MFSLPRICRGVKSSCKPSTNLSPILRAAASHNQPLFLSAATEQGGQGRLPIDVLRRPGPMCVAPLSYAASSLTLRLNLDRTYLYGLLQDWDTDKAVELCVAALLQS